MKRIVLGVSAAMLFLALMYYRKQQKNLQMVDLEEMRKPQINVVSELVTDRLLEQLEKLSQIYETKIEPKKKKFRLLLGSAERDVTTYPNVTQYQLRLPQPIYGMNRITLDKATFPTSLNLINSSNDTVVLSGSFTFPAGTQIFSYSASLTIGNYTPARLASMVEEAINTAAAADIAYSTSPTFDVTVDANTYIATTVSNVFPVLAFPLVGTATASTLTYSTSASYIRTLLGYGTETAIVNGVRGNDPVNVLYNQTILIELSNRFYDFNSLRIMSRTNNDRRAFASITMPSGNGISGAAGNLVSGAGSGGFGNYVVTKDMTNAYYEAYEGPIPSTEYITVRLRQLLPDGTLTTPDFNNADHSLEFEVDANIDKASLTEK